MISPGLNPIGGKVQNKLKAIVWLKYYELQYFGRIHVSPNGVLKERTQLQMGATWSHQRGDAWWFEEPPPPTLKVAIIFRLPEISVKPGPFEYVLGLPNSHEVD